MKMTPRERAFLNFLIAKKSDIIESKFIDGICIREKKKVWTEIQLSFNQVHAHRERTVKQIQKYWDNEKTRRKKQLASKRSGPEGSHTDAVVVELGTSAIDSEAAFERMSSKTGKSTLISPSGHFVENRKGTHPVEEVASDHFVKDGVDPAPPTRKRKTDVGSRDEALDLEREARRERHGQLLQFDRELHAERMKEAELRAKIARVEFETALNRLEVEKRKLLNDINFTNNNLLSFE